MRGNGLNIIEEHTLYPAPEDNAVPSRSPRYSTALISRMQAAPGATKGPPIITGRQLSKRFGQTVALDGVDLMVAAGEAVAVMGPSGSGKSTLLHCMAGILVPDDGVVTLEGQRIDNLRERQRSALRRTRFGFVFQDHQLLPELPAEENVALPLLLGGMKRGLAVERARKWLQMLGLEGLERRRPGQISGGQAQRVAVARALVTEPLVVFADEPTGSLDRKTGRETLRLLVESTTRQNAALIIVTHDPEVASHCDRTVEVRDGRLRPAVSSGAIRKEGW